MPRYTLTLRNLDLETCSAVVVALANAHVDIDLEWTTEEVAG